MPTILGNIFGVLSGKLTYILLGAIGIIFASFGAYYFYSSSKISSLQKANVEMSLAIEEQKNTILRFKKANADIQKANAQIRIKEGRLRSRVVALESQLRGIFNNKNATAETIEKDIRKIEQDRLRCFEIITGSPLTDGDKQNSICPQNNKPL